MHPFLEKLKQAHRGSRREQIACGLSLPFSSAKFLLQNNRLLPFAVMPALINLVLFALSAYLLATNAGDLLDWLWERPVVDGLIGYVLIALWYAAYVVTLALAIIVSYMIVLVAGGVVASPFHDFLSEHTERILRGVDQLPDTGESAASGLIRSVISSACIGLLYAALMVPILLLNLIPLAGSIASTLLGGCVSAYFVGLEYTDPTLERHGVRIKDKFRLIWENLPLAGSFGLGTSMLLWVPLMNFVCMPIAVIGGTALGIALEESASPSTNRGTES